MQFCEIKLSYDEIDTCLEASSRLLHRLDIKVELEKNIEILKKLSNNELIRGGSLNYWVLAHCLRKHRNRLRCQWALNPPKSVCDNVNGALKVVFRMARWRGIKGIGKA